MRERMIFAMFILLFVAILLSGCHQVNLRRTDINEIRLFNVIGIDKISEGSDTVQITAVSKETVTGGGSSGSDQSGGSQGQQITFITSSKGRTLLEAMDYLYTISDRTPFLGHVEYVLIGEEAAKEDIVEYLDLFFRYYDIRLNLIVMVVKEGTAEQVIRTIGKEEGFIGDKLKSIFKDKGDLSISDEILIIDVMEALDNECASLLIPSIYLVEEKKQDPSGKQGGYKVKLDGYGVFKGTKLVGYIQGDTARGLNWAKGKVESGIFILKDRYGNDVTLEIINTDSKIKPEINDGKLKVSIEINLSSNIAEIRGEQDIWQRPIIDELRRQQESIVKGEVGKVLSLAQSKNTDIFPICDAVWHKYPVQWESIKKDWDDIFPGLDIQIKVKSIINRTYDIRQPVRGNEGEE